MSINHTKPLSAIALKRLILKAEKGAFKPIGTFEQFKKKVMMIWKNSKSKKYSLLIATLFALNSCQNNDAILLKELKQQNEFLEKERNQLKELISVKVCSNPFIKTYAKLFSIQDSSTNQFLEKLNIFSKDNVNSSFIVYIKKYNSFIDSASKESNTKFFPADRPLLNFKYDSITETTNLILKKEIIKLHILQQQIILAKLCIESSSSCGFFGTKFINSFGYRLTIEKKDSISILNLKCYDPRKLPYFEKLEFISILKIQKSEYSDLDELSDISSSVLKKEYENDAIKLKFKLLPTGFYRINCNKLSISEIGRLLKEPTYYDFEIN